MKQTLIVFVLFFFCIQRIHAQESFTQYRTVRINIMPLSLIDYTPRLRIGLDFDTKGQFGYSCDFGIGNSKINNGRLDGMIWGKNYSFYEIRPEIKYTLLENNYSNLYCATEFFYLLMRDQLESGHYQKENSDFEIEYDYANFRKQKYGAHLKGGVSLSLYERLNVDFYWGIGVAERIIDYTHVLNPVEMTEPIFVEWVPQNYLFEGESVIFHMTMGFKVGYIFRRKTN
ncbi:MAG: hypothetical protein JXA77_16910 [Bacteroidales bacterium]|nr:hypothetical protein [Bacteroidales bacterium]MBN2819382.1 hypothetical protein [Bacteroidales bacterium]